MISTLERKASRLKSRRKPEVCLGIDECRYITDQLSREFCGYSTRINHKNVGKYISTVCKQFPDLCKLSKRYK